MEGLRWTSEAYVWLKNRPADTNCIVTGIYLDGNETWEVASGLTVTGFHQPMNRLDIRCEKNLTYRQVMTEYLTARMEGTVRQTQGKAAHLIAFVLPQRAAWVRDAQIYLSFLTEICDHIRGAEKVIPVLVPAAWALAGKDELRGDVLYIVTDREWTECTWLRSGEKSGKMTCAVHLGLQEGKNPSAPVRVRINDFLHDSTSEWEDFAAENTPEAFRRILQALQENGWNGYRQIQMTCPDSHWDAMKRVLSDQNMVCHHKNRASMCLSLQEIVRCRIPESTQKPRQNNSQKTNDRPAGHSGQSLRNNYNAEDPFAL